MSGEVLNSAVFSALFCCSSDHIAGEIEDVGGKNATYVFGIICVTIYVMLHINALRVQYQNTALC